MITKLKNEWELIRGMIHNVMQFFNLIPSRKTEQVATDICLFSFFGIGIILFFLAIMKFNAATTGAPY